MAAYQVEVTITCTAKLYFEAADGDEATALAEGIAAEDIVKKTCHWPLTVDSVTVDSCTEQTNFVS